jgi:hypothetical protein
MQLGGRAVGAHVRFFKNLRVQESPSSVNLLCFKLWHQGNPKYQNLNRVNDRNYIPVWLGNLAKNALSMQPTLILLEMPPFFERGLLKYERILQTAPVELILSHSIRRLRPHFGEKGFARGRGWVMDGCDLRYRYDEVGRNLKMHPSGDSRAQSLHRDLPGGDLGATQYGTASIKDYYDYLTTLKGDDKSYKGFVNGMKSDWRFKQQGPVMELIFKQAAFHCRRVYAGVPDKLKRVISKYFFDKFYEVSRERNWDTRASIKYGFGEQLMNIYLFGYIFSTEGHFRNIVIVAGGDHINAIEDFIKKDQNETYLLGYKQKVYAHDCKHEIEGHSAFLESSINLD